RNFGIGLMMIVLFSVHLGWLPTGGYIPISQDFLGWLRTATMPAVALALLQVGLLARITRSTMLEVLRQDYVRTARAKGLPNYLVIGKHALANAMIPIVTVVGIIVSLLISGSVVTETVFSVPGVGQLLTSAILNRDYPMIQGALLFVTLLVVGINIAMDIAYAGLDPRVRFEGGGERGYARHDRSRRTYSARRERALGDRSASVAAPLLSDRPRPFLGPSRGGG